MKFTEPWERQRLSFLLEKAASREARTWKVYVPKKPSSQDTDISPAQRDEAVHWLMELHGELQLYPETLVLAISILDRFLAPIKARPKYLRCIAITCYFLSAKTCEEDECVPSLKDLVGSSGCGCSASEILRMERIILDKLNWDLHTATPLDFLHIFHAMASSCRSRFLESALGKNRSQHLAGITQQLYLCLADHTLSQLRGSMLALALVTLELESCCPDWLPLTIELLSKAQMSSSELIRGRELVARSLSTPTASLPPNTVYIYRPPAHACCTAGFSSRQPEDEDDDDDDDDEDAGQQLWLSASCSSIPALLTPPTRLRHLRPLQPVTLHCKASTKRKVEEMEVDDFFDGIKRLYNEDTTATAQEGATPSITTGGAEGGGGGGALAVLFSRLDGGSSPCPPLQPVGAS
ncbi:hypothetical protein LDENG_00031300 [Lucifuga dentata]|nr:hypothetical protein LDENG_00031300 [Lucifuga dentata]